MPSSIYHLTEFQFKNLDNAANNSQTTVLAILDTHPTDSLENLRVLEKNQREMQDLVNLGLMRDISESFSDSINEHLAKGERGYKIVILTDEGLKMFRRHEKRLVN